MGAIRIVGGEGGWKWVWRGKGWRGKGWRGGRAKMRGDVGASGGGEGGTSPVANAACTRRIPASP